MATRIPSLASLRAFEAVSRHLSFSKAAGELCVSHAAISHQIKLLESELGLKLFNRTSRSVSLTDRREPLLPGNSRQSPSNRQRQQRTLKRQKWL